MDFFNLLFDNFETNLLIFSRVLGIFLFNPVLSRKNVPVIAKIGCCMCITAIVAMTMQFEPVDSGVQAGVYLLMMLRRGHRVCDGYVLLRCADGRRDNGYAGGSWHG